MNVIIADDHPIVLFGIRKSLEQIEWVNVVGEFEDSTALINNLPKLDAHVLITDLSMPGDKYGDGITLIKYIKRHFPSLSIIVLTMNNNPAILSAVLDLDIEGIVLKQGAPTDLPKALAALQKGKKFTPESVSRLLEKISAGGYGDKRLSRRLRRQAPVTSACRQKRAKYYACSPRASWSPKSPRSSTAALRPSAARRNRR
ncbi:DNA-binding capsular synthesis response regulator RcsB [Salmonella enterica subsp. enterica serovar Adelaide str. A4-669]|uniref:DNA-binding capsular synthesis response regulator RcsB n=1 Tax=Salmonella enterica subsp. enterica serovar Adelaide str. A4-669 TaxID=913063 RepID=A0A6C8GQD2_SALET|nr:DNA-binding capsular synthesis response regulator RcsB [Salmonella enterica subsp. enterica serovar Adelaide str. A4-669]